MADEMIIEDKQPTNTKSRPLCIFFSLLVIVILICGVVYFYLQSTKVNHSLSTTVLQLQDQVSTNQHELATVKQSLDELQAATQKSQALSAQQEQLMSEWKAAQKGDLDKWHVAEAQYLAKLANDHVQFTQDIPLALTLLQRADQVLQNLQDPKLVDIRKSIANDITNLQAIPQIDVTGLYLRLSALNNQMDNLPLPINPLKTEAATAATTTSASNVSWWRAGLQNSWDALRKIVVIRYNPSNSLPLVMPEEKAFLYQNLHAQIEAAMWGVLHRNAPIYQTNLARAIAWIKRYFDNDANETKAILQNLDELRKVNVQLTPVNLSATLQLFDHYLADTTQTKTA